MQGRTTQVAGSLLGTVGLTVWGQAWEQLGFHPRQLNGPSVEGCGRSPHPGCRRLAFWSQLCPFRQMVLTSLEIGAKGPLSDFKSHTKCLYVCCCVLHSLLSSGRPLSNFFFPLERLSPSKIEGGGILFLLKDKYLFCVSWIQREMKRCFKMCSRDFPRG